MPRKAPPLRCAALAVLVAATGGYRAAADEGPPKEVSFRDLHRDGDAVIIGHVGLPIGRIIRLEGRRARRSKMSNDATLEVLKVNGREPPVREARGRIEIQVHNVDSLPEDETVVVEGFEFARWIGEPATNWHLGVEFQVAKVVSPSAIVLKERGPRPTAPRAIEVVTPSLLWMIHFELSGAAHAQYGSLPGDGGFVPPGTVDLPALARALSAAAGGGASKGPDRIQVTASSLCPEGAEKEDCDWQSGALEYASDAQQRVVLRLLEALEPQWQADEFGTRRFEELRRKHPIAPGR